MVLWDPYSRRIFSDHRCGASPRESSSNIRSSQHLSPRSTFLKSKTVSNTRSNAPSLSPWFEDLALVDLCCVHTSQLQLYLFQLPLTVAASQLCLLCNAEHSSLFNKPHSHWFMALIHPHVGLGRCKLSATRAVYPPSASQRLASSIRTRTPHCGAALRSLVRRFLFSLTSLALGPPLMSMVAQVVSATPLSFPNVILSRLKLPIVANSLRSRESTCSPCITD